MILTFILPDSRDSETVGKDGFTDMGKTFLLYVDGTIHRGTDGGGSEERQLRNG